MYVSGAVVTRPDEQLPPAGRRVRRKVPCDPARASGRLLRARTRPRRPRCCSHAIARSDGTRASVVTRAVARPAHGRDLRPLRLRRNGDPTDNLIPIFRVPKNAPGPCYPDDPVVTRHSEPGAARALSAYPTRLSVSRQRALDGCLAGGTPRQREERDRARLLPEGLARAGEHAVAEEGRAGGPRRAVVAPPLRAHLRADRDQLGQVGDRLDDVPLGDAHEAVGVQVVAEQERGVAVTRLEQPRPAVVEEVALVDRLEAELVLLPREVGEDRLALLLVGRPERRLPERALARRAGADQRPTCQRSLKSPTASTVRSTSSSEWARDTNIASNWDGAT